MGRRVAMTQAKVVLGLAGEMFQQGGRSCLEANDLRDVFFFFFFFFFKSAFKRVTVNTWASQI